MNTTVQQKGSFENEDKAQNPNQASVSTMQNNISYTMIEQALDEIKEFINIMYGSCIRFYNTLLTHTELEDMKEDLIEKITTLLFYNEGLTDLVINLC